MKKISRNIFFFTIFFVFFLGLAPRLFFLDKVQKTITEKVSQSLASTVTIKKMHWVWLPLPHLTFIGTSLTDSHYDFFLPKVKVYPTWQFILGDTSKPGKIVLDNPQFYINKKAFLPRVSAERILPDVTIAVKNGEIEVEATDNYLDILRKDSVKFSDINGTLKLQPQVLEMDIRGSSPASKKISLQGRLNIPERNYSFSVDAQDVKLHKSFTAFLDGRLIPVESPARFSGTVTGKGLQYLEGNLNGTLPCFVVMPQDREVLLTCGFADLKFLKSGNLLRLDINDLEIKDPQINLSGYIERKLSSISSTKSAPTSKPIWTLDITGSDMDLTAIRQKILTLWRENKVAKIVSDIVLAGKALSAAYRFSGTTADFKKLRAMVIEADFLNADIHVPGVDLDLTDASGPIQIKDSILTGHSLSARMGNSYGRNAEVLLDIGKLGDTFKLDIDIDADLAALPPILAQLVKHDGFQQELTKFNNVSGKASGTVHLGDSLTKITTRVDVKNMQLTTRYDPVPKPIVIESGALQVEPENVRWKDVTGHIGQQEITETSGYVSWQTGNPLLNIDRMQARLKGESLHALLKETEVIPKKIDNVLSAINGTIKISQGSLHGPALRPASWEYDLTLSTSGLAISSPLLPEPVTTKEVSGTISHGEANIREAAIQFLDQSFSLKGLLKHQLLENWHGMIEFNGPLYAKLASWISSKGWFPEKLRPQIPCTMENMQVNWQGKTVAVSGTILHGLGGGRLPMAKIDYVNTPEQLHINELSFYAAGEQGRLELQFWRHSPHSLALSWEGFVNAENIAALFEHSSFKAGTFSGAFEINYFAEKPEATSFEGLLSAENLLLNTKNSKEPVVITRIDMSGIGKQLRIIDLNLLAGSEEISGSGQLAVEKEGLQLDVSLASPFISRRSLTNLSSALQETHTIFFHGHTAQVPGFQLPKGWDVTGRIGFDFDSFALTRKTITPYDDEKSITYTFYDVQGDLQLAPDKISRTEIFSSKLCGLDFRGTWFSDAALGQKFHLATDPDTISRLEIVLPCLGVEQDIIEGEFTLKANLQKESDSWYGGNIYITSAQGRILRLKTLSRVFKVVNITDLFDEQVQGTGKKGFPFSKMDIDTHIHANNLVLDRAIIHGEGLNLFARGEIHLDDYDADLTLLIAPLKTFDTVISKVPIIGSPVTGADGSMVNIPVAISGPIADPTITPLHPEAIGDAVLNIIKGTFMLPYNILKPLEKSEKNKNQTETEGN